MKKVFLSLVLFCGLALISTSCNKDNNTVTPEVEEGAVTVGSKTMDIVASNAVKYGQQNAIVLTSKEMTAADNEGIAIIFNAMRVCWTLGSICFILTILTFLNLIIFTYACAILTFASRFIII